MGLLLIEDFQRLSHHSKEEAAEIELRKVGKGISFGNHREGSEYVVTLIHRWLLQGHEDTLTFV
jgi:hypothetical protein